MLECPVREQCECCDEKCFLSWHIGLFVDEQEGGEQDLCEGGEQDLCEGGKQDLCEGGELSLIHI